MLKQVLASMGWAYTRACEEGRQAMGPGNAGHAGENRPAGLDSLVLGHSEG